MTKPYLAAREVLNLTSLDVYVEEGVMLETSSEEQMHIYELLLDTEGEIWLCIRSYKGLYHLSSFDPKY